MGHKYCIEIVDPVKFFFAFFCATLPFSGSYRGRDNMGGRKVIPKHLIWIFDSNFSK